MLSNLPEKLNRGQMEGNVGRTIGVHSNHVVSFIHIGQVIAPITGDGVEVGLVHIEPSTTDLDNARINFHTIDGQVAVDGRVLSRDGPRRRPD